MSTENGWMPIETAPKDGTAVLLWCSERLYLGYCEPTDDHAPWRSSDCWFLKATVLPRLEYGRNEQILGCYEYDARPSHWQPLPPPPSTDTVG